MKRLKKILAVALAMAMVLGMTSMAAFADETNTTVSAAAAKGTGEFDITLTGAEAGHTFKAYRIFDGSISTDGKLGDISWVTGVNTDGITSALTGAGLRTDVVSGKTLDFTKAADVALALSKQSDDSDVMKKVADVFYARKGTAAGTVNAKTGDNYVIENLVAGYYLVTDEYTNASNVPEGAATLSRNILAVVGDVTAKVKNVKPTVEKKILSPNPVDANKAGVGETVAYRITGSVPNYAGYDKYFYVINDTLSSGLTFDGAQNVVVKVGSTTLTADDDYVVYTGANADGYTFRVAFKKIKNYAVDTPITVTYSATVNSNAVVGGTGNPNEVDVTYSNNPNNSSQGNPGSNPKPGDDVPTGTSVKDKTITYISELDLTKYFDEVASGKELSGAQFTLTGQSTVVVGTGSDNFVADADGTYYKLSSGTFTTTAPHDDIKRSDGTVAVNSNKSNYDQTDLAAGTKYKLQHVTTYDTQTKDVFMQGTSGSGGKITFKGLGAGTYTLKETITPQGYTTAQDITFTITINPPTEITTGEENATYSVTAVTPEGSVALNGADTAGLFKSDVIDLSGQILPSTGGIGTTIFYIVGAILVIGAGVVLITRRRMNA